MRFTTNLVHVEPWWFYAMVIGVGMLPASFLLPIMAMYLFRRTPALLGCRTQAQGYLLLVSVWTLLFFSLSTGKLAPYILPALPPLCLLLGAMLDKAVLADVDDAFMTRMRRWIPFHGTRIALICGVVLGIADYVVNRGKPDQWVKSLLLVLGSSLLYWYVSRKSFAQRPARWPAAAAIPLALLGVGLIDIYPSIATKRSLAAQVDTVRRECHDDEMPIICFGRYEDSLMFYNRETEISLFNIAQLDEIRGYLVSHPRVLVLTQEEHITRLRKHLPANIALEEQALSRGKLYLAISSPTDTPRNELSAGPADESRR